MPYPSSKITISQISDESRRERTASSPEEAGENGIDFYQLGLAQHQRGQLEAAEKSYRQAIEILDATDRDRLYIYNNLGCVLVAREQFEKAIVVYQAAREIDPKFAPLYNNLGRLWLARGNLDRAIVAYRYVLELAPNNTLALHHLGKALQKQQHHAEALACFQQVLQLDDSGSPSTLGECGRSALASGQIDRGFAYLHRAVALQPEWVAAYSRRMAQLVADNDLDRMRQASGRLLAALENDPDDPQVRESVSRHLMEVYFYRGRVEFQVGWVDRAREDYLKAKAIWSNHSQPNHSQIEAELQTCEVERQRLEARQRDYRDRPEALPPTLPRGIYPSTRAWWLATGLDARHYISVTGNTQEAATPESCPTPPNFGDPPCAGLNCSRCLDRISRQFNLDRLETGIWRFGEGDSVAAPPPEQFVATIPDGRVWMMPQENWWHVCEAIAVISPDNHLLADVSREYPGQLPGCDRHDPRQHRIFRQETLPPPERIRGTVAVVGGLSANIYFHWIVDVLPKLDLLRESGFEWEDIDYFLFNEIRQPFARESLQRLGIPESKILQSDRHPHVIADRLVVPSFPDRLGWASPRTIDFLRRTFLPDRPSHTPTPERIYISRAQAGYRRLFNEAEVVDFLQGLGFVSIRLEDHSLDEQVRLFSQAKVILSPHGSGLTNIIFCQPGTQVIELVSPHYTRHYFSAISRQLGLVHYIVTAQTLKCSPLREWIYPSSLAEDILVDLERLQKILTEYVKLCPNSGSSCIPELDRTPFKPMSVSDRSSSPALRLFEQAELRFDRREFDAAFRICQEALKVDGNFAPASKLMGNILLARGQVEEAQKYYVRAIELKPNYGEAYANLGSLAARQKDWKSSIAYYQKAIALQPDLTVAHRNLAKVWQKLGKNAEAIDSLYSAYELDPQGYKPEEHLNLGNTLFEQGQLSQAIACYQRALKLNPHLVGAYQNLAEALTRQGRFQEANNYYRHIVRQDLTQPKLPTRIERISEQRQEIPSPPSQNPLEISSEASAYPLNPETSPWLALAAYEFMGRVLESQQDVNRAYQNLGQAIQRHEKLYEEGVRYRETVRMLATGTSPDSADVSEAGGLRRWFSSLVGFLSGGPKTEPSSPNLLPPALPDRRKPSSNQLELGSTDSIAEEYVETGNALLAHGEVNRAIRCYQRAIHLNPKLEEAYQKLGDALSQNDRPAEALMYYRQARELREMGTDRPTETLNGAGEFEPSSTNGTNEIVETIEPLFELSQLPTTDETTSSSEPLFSENVTEKEAEKPSLDLAPKVASPQPTSPEPSPSDRVVAYLRLGSLYIQQQQWEEALDTYTQALEIEPELWEARERLGDIAIAREQWQEAERCYRAVLEVEPHAWQVHNKLGDVLQAQGQLDEAIAAYRRAAGSLAY
ncbi:MAG: tetratricopeptide repeat protein [Cyanobacteriota bacterium]|nr:tetratricopeptide repeat protein [Cyanobacteriota bacterium]